MTEATGLGKGHTRAMVQMPDGSRRPKRRSGPHQVVRIELTHRGETKTSWTTAEALRRGRDLYEKHRQQIVEEDGRSGKNYRFTELREADSVARSSTKKWGYTHDHWHSLHLNACLVAVHLLRATEYSMSAPDCRHPQHGNASHTCEAFQVIEEQAAPQPAARPAPMQQRLQGSREISAAPAEAAMPTGGLDDTPPEAIHLSPRRSHDGVQDLASEPEPGLTSIRPHNPGLGIVDVHDILRDLASIQDASPPRLIHVHQEGNVIDVFVVAGIKGDEAIRFNEQRLRMLGHDAGARPTGPPTPRDYVNVASLTTYFYDKVGATGASCSDAMKDLGPWRPEQFKRDHVDFKAWQEAFHDAMRGGLLKNELARRGRLLRKVTAQNAAGTEVDVQNEYGELFWTAEATQ